jgi:hypothetical protein
LHTTIFVEIAGREDEQQPFSGRCGNSASGAVEERGIEGSKLLLLFCPDRVIPVSV